MRTLATIKLLSLSLVLSLTTPAAYASIEPTTAFGHAFDIGVDAVLSHLQITKSHLGPKASVDRNKNIEGEFADFVVHVQINRISAENKINQCEVSIFISKNESAEAGDILLGKAQAGEIPTVATVNRIRCQ